MAATVYRTKADEMLDAICVAHYGTSAVVETVLEANPGLAALGPRLPVGTRVTLPEIAAPATVVDTIRLWD